MSTKATMSSHMESSFNLDHNERKIPVPHSDKKYEEKNNFYYEQNQTLEEAYEHLFGESFRAYNSTVRKDRQEESYLLKLTKGMEREQEKISKMRAEGKSYHSISKAKRAVKPAYEMIFAFGNIDDNPEFAKGGDKQEQAKKALQEYVEGFQKRNPNVYLFNASIHTGESGVCHLHADIIFWADGFTRGQARQTNLTKALNAMGFYTQEMLNPDGTPKLNKNGQPKTVNAITLWQDREREVLREIARKYDIEIVAGKHSRGHRDIATFQLEQEQARLERKEQKFKENFSKVKANIEKVSAKQHAYNAALDKKEAELDERESAVEKKEQDLEFEILMNVEGLVDAIEKATDTFESPGKRLNEYEPVKFKKGYRAVPEKELDTYISNSWFNPQYVRAEMQKIVEGFNSLSFVRKLRKEIQQLRDKFHELHEQIEELRIKNQMQKNLLEKTKHIRLDNGKTVYEEITAQNTRKPEEKTKQEEHSDQNVRQNNHPVWDDDER